MASNKSFYEDMNNVNVENYLRDLSVEMTNYENTLNQVTSSNLDLTFQAFINLFAKVINPHAPLRPSSRKKNAFKANLGLPKVYLFQQRKKQSYTNSQDVYR